MTNQLQNRGHAASAQIVFCVFNKLIPVSCVLFYAFWISYVVSLLPFLQHLRGGLVLKESGKYSFWALYQWFLSSKTETFLWLTHTAKRQTKTLGDGSVRHISSLPNSLFRAVFHSQYQCFSIKQPFLSHTHTQFGLEHTVNHLIVAQAFICLHCSWHEAFIWKETCIRERFIFLLSLLCCVVLCYVHQEVGYGAKHEVS